MSTAWDDIGQEFITGAIKQGVLNEQYGNVALLLQDERSADPGFKNCAKDLQSMIQNNPDCAAPLNAALADPKNRTAVFQLAKDNPAKLNAAVQQISTHPENTSAIVEGLQKTSNTQTQPAAPASPAATTNAPEKPAQEQGADGKMHPVKPGSSTAAPGTSSNPAVASNNPSTTADASASPDDSASPAAKPPQAKASAGNSVVNFFKDLWEDFVKIIKFVVAAIGAFFGGLSSGHSASHPTVTAGQQGQPPHSQESPSQEPPSRGQSQQPLRAQYQPSSQSPSPQHLQGSVDFEFPLSANIPAGVRAQASSASAGLRESGVTPTAEDRTNIAPGAKAAPTGQLIST